MGNSLSGADRTRLSDLTIEPKLAAVGWQMAFLGDEADKPDTIFHPALNAALAAGADLPFVLSRKVFGPDDAWMIEKRVAEMTASGKSVFDSPKIRLAEDPIPGVPVLLEQTSYFKGLVTNELCLKTYHPCDNVSIDGTDRAFPMSMIPKLSRSRMSNHIGAASLAFDDDGVVCLCVTGAAAVVASGKVSPSAAGSLDVECMDDAVSLTRAISDTVSRELAEETGMDPETGVETRVIAFIRDLSRGGKPEFVAVSKVRGRWSEIASELRDDEKKFTAGHLMVDVRSIGMDGMNSWMMENSGRTSYALKSAWEFLCMEMTREGNSTREWISV